jgi:hypothetical protein
MMKLTEIRRENMRALIEKHGAGKLSAKLGYSQPSFLSQMCGPNPTRDITEKSARRYETLLKLPAGYLDTMHGEESAPQPEKPAADPNMVADVIRLVGSICASEEVNLPPMKFAEVVALAYLDTVEHDQTPREDHIKQVVRLLK